MSEKKKPWQFVKSSNKPPKHVKMTPYNRNKAETK